ncbi:hypothetical protein [Sphingopyxis sp. PET50]|uniref:hypothetical protein n=1 Tax=Sphingopyxis sp. PET50 TaxID=2976533 RepID=UPI0021B04525|nr:hypothetical protein [Sphingopyxis sp. PET50]
MPSATAAPDRFDTDAESDVVAAKGADRTGEALWPVPPRQQWGQVISQDGKNIWKDAVFTDPEGRWQILFPATMTEQFGDVLSRSRMFRYPGQPHITCSTTIIGRQFDDLGDDAAVLAPATLASRRDAIVEKVRDPAAPAANIRMVELAGPKGAAGQPVQAIMFDQKGKLLEPLGVDREVVARTLVATDDDDLLVVSCTAHPGQKGWVEKHTPQALRLTTLAREVRR